MSFIDYVNAALDIAKKAQSIELERQILAMQTEMNDMQRQNLDLGKQVATLEEEKNIRAKLAYEAPSYYVQNKNGTRDGPYCQPCWDGSGKLIRTVDRDAAGGVYRKCFHCNAEVKVGSRPHDDPYRGFGGKGGWT